ncbi:MAG TPA: hypothetical protein VKW09_09970 [bacterium]|nr:hypothetical protein [bacterium]
MPQVDSPADIEERLKKAWRLASEGPDIATLTAAPAGQRYIVVVTPGRATFIQPCPRPGSMDPNSVQAIQRIAPPHSPSNIAVIAFTRFEPTMASMSKAIPFLGYVMGLGYVGHNVIVFEGQHAALTAGCRDADMVIVDEAMIPHLDKGWMNVIFGAMRGTQLLVFGRNGSVKRIGKKLDQAG